MELVIFGIVILIIGVLCVYGKELLLVILLLILAGACLYGIYYSYMSSVSSRYEKDNSYKDVMTVIRNIMKKKNFNCTTLILVTTKKNRDIKVSGIIGLPAELYKKLCCECYSKEQVLNEILEIPYFQLRDFNVQVILPDIDGITEYGEPYIYISCELPYKRENNVSDDLFCFSLRKGFSPYKTKQCKLQLQNEL